MSDATLRCFLAVEVPTAVRDRLGSLCTELEQTHSELRVVPSENLHITLKFLGDFPEGSIPRLARQAATKLLRTPPFEVTLAGLGAFPHQRSARVIWIGIQRGASQLARIARKLDSTAGRLGAARDRRPYQPHLTLGRLREPCTVALEQLRAPDPMSFPVADVVLFESRLAPSGATHLPLARLPIGPPTDESSDDFHPFAPDF